MYIIWEKLKLLNINLVEIHLVKVKFQVKQGLLEDSTCTLPGDGQPLLRLPYLCSHICGEADTSAKFSSDLTRTE